MARLSEQFAMHPLSPDERVTCESMLAQVSWKKNGLRAGSR